MTATVTANGKPQRKQLSDQLDRMDSIIDALADALPEAVADACREGARQAVKDAVVEILASPELRTLITGLAAARVVPPPAAPASAPADAGPPKPRFWSRVKALLLEAKSAVTRRCRVAAATVAAATRTAAAVLPVKKILTVAAGVGVAVGVVSYACPHALSAVIGGVGAAFTAVGVQVGTWVRRSAGRLGFGGTG